LSGARWSRSSEYAAARTVDSLEAMLTELIRRLDAK
jgi:hypothetical protein